MQAVPRKGCRLFSFYTDPMTLLLKALVGIALAVTLDTLTGGVFGRGILVVAAIGWGLLLLKPASPAARHKEISR